MIANLSNKTDQAVDVALRVHPLKKAPTVTFRPHRLGGYVVAVHLEEAPSLDSLKRLTQEQNLRLFERFLESLDDSPKSGY